MAIDFEKEEKSRRWMFILPIAVLSLALCTALWAYSGKSSELRRLNTEYSLATKELEKYRKLYVSTSSDISGTEHIADMAELRLQECLRANTLLQDQLNALELTMQAGTANTEQ